MDKVDHEKLETAQAILERYRPEVAGLCKILGELAEAGDKFNFTFMVLTIQDLVKQSFDRLTEGGPSDGGPSSELMEFTRVLKW